MRNIILFLVLLLASCRASVSDSAAIIAIDEETKSKPDSIPVYEDDIMPDEYDLSEFEGNTSNDHDIAWSGSIKSTGASIFIHYHINDDIVVGSLIYSNDTPRKTLPLLGYIGKNGIPYKMFAFSPNGEIESILKLKKVGNNLTGAIVYPATSNKDIPVSFTTQSTRLSSIDDEAISYEGRYAFNYKGRGANGTLRIDKNEDGTYRFLANHKQAFSSDIYQAKAAKFSIEDGAFRYNSQQNESCGFIVKIFNDFLVVQSKTQDFPNCRGTNQSIFFSGIYYKIGN